MTNLNYFYILQSGIVPLSFLPTCGLFCTDATHLHISIVSRHLATRGNNKIRRIPPPHTSSYAWILPRLTRRAVAQLITNK